VLHYFSGAPTDGGNSIYADLLQASDGNFYGITTQNGSYGNGAIVRITPAGLETVVYSFGNGADGQNPLGSLIQGSDGNFYGTTNVGGAQHAGTVFKVTPTGVETEPCQNL